MTSDAPPEESLKRLGGGRWETKDGRFTIEPASGTWSVLDAEETDELGLPLVRGPFRSLTDAKNAIAEARTSEPPSSPLAGRPKRRSDTARSTAPEPERAERTRAEKPENRPTRRTKAQRDDEPEKPEEPEEPAWFRDLAPAERGRARRLIDRLLADGASDAASIVRRDLAGGVPALAAHAIERRLAELPGDAGAAQVAELLADGRDDNLGVRWRIVDGDGRPILIDLPRRPRGRR
jgi:hypothetical protein